MALARSVYNAIFKRSSTTALTIVLGAFIFERTFDLAAESIFERINEGKLWKHIKHNYGQ